MKETLPGFSEGTVVCCDVGVPPIGSEVQGMDAPRPVGAQLSCRCLPLSSDNSYLREILMGNGYKHDCELKAVTSEHTSAPAKCRRYEKPKSIWLKNQCVSEEGR